MYDATEHDETAVRVRTITATEIVADFTRAVPRGAPDDQAPTTEELRVAHAELLDHAERHRQATDAANDYAERIARELRRRDETCSDAG